MKLLPTSHVNLILKLTKLKKMFSNVLICRCHVYNLVNAPMLPAVAILDVGTLDFGFIGEIINVLRGAF